MRCCTKCKKLVDNVVHLTSLLRKESTKLAISCPRHSPPSAAFVLSDVAETLSHLMPLRATAALVNFGKAEEAFGRVDPSPRGHRSLLLPYMCSSAADVRVTATYT